MKGKSTKTALLMSFTSLLLCAAMLIGTTFAWFTDSVTSGVNKIVAGNLDVDVLHTSAKVTTPESIKEQTNLFRDASGNAMLWEPGAVSYEKFTVKNLGTLALKYNMSMNVAGYNKVKDTNYSLLDVLKVAILEGEAASNFAGTREAAAALTYSSKLSDFVKSGFLLAGESGSEASFTIVIYWQPTDNDNNWNVNNGKQTSDGNPALWIDLGINVVATQKDHEYDSFDNQYDVTAENQLPAIGTTVSATKSNTEIGENDAVLTTELATVTVPKENLPEDDAYSLRLDVERIENIANDQDFAVTAAVGNTLCTYDVSLVKIVNEEETPLAETEKVYTVSLFVGKYNEVLKFYHKGVQVTDFTYDVNTGYVTFKTNSFSPYATEVSFAGGLGTEEHPYLISSAQEFLMINKLVNNFSEKAYHFKLINDIDISDTSTLTKLSLGGTPCDYIYYFQGSFDGDGHKVYEGDNYTFLYNLGDMTVKNVTFVEKCKDDNFILLVYPNAYQSYSGLVTFENVNVVGEDESALYTCSSTYWVAAALNYGSLLFKNCNSYINYTCTDDYIGVFFGSYICAGASASYINCHNYGNVSGTNLGLFNGNGNGKTLELLSSPEATPSSGKSGVYIENCSNEGDINCTVSYSPFSTYAASGDPLTSITDVNEAIVQENQFTPGNAVVAGLDLSLSKSGSTVQVNTVDSVKIAKYKVTVYVGSGGKYNTGASWGSSYFKIAYEFEKDAQDKSVPYIKAFVMSDQYATPYADIASVEKDTLEGVKYKEVSAEDGVTIVINTESALAEINASLHTDDVASINCGSTPSYRIDATDSNNVNLGSKTYSANELNA